MLDRPKGLKYWNDNGIDPKAPQWAKTEFKEYQKLMNPIHDKNGIINQY